MSSPSYGKKTELEDREENYGGWPSENRKDYPEPSYSYPPPDDIPPTRGRRDYGNYPPMDDRDPDSGNPAYSRHNGPGSYPPEDLYPPPRGRRRSLSPGAPYDPYYDLPPRHHMGPPPRHYPAPYAPYDDPYYGRPPRSYSPYDEGGYGRHSPYGRPPVHRGYRDEYPSAPRGGSYYEGRGRHGGNEGREERRQRQPPPNDKATEELKSKSTTIWVGNLPYSYKEDDVTDMFDKFGKLVKVTVPIDRYTGKNKGFAFIEFESRKEAEEAYDHYLGTDVEGRKVRVDWDIGIQSKEKKYGGNNGNVEG